MSEGTIHKDEKVQKLIKENKSILLMGAPNVGKSVFFSKLTKIHVISSNYTGTTVTYMKGDYIIEDEKYTLVDVPGTYSLAATNEAEAIAVEFLETNPDGVLFVLNAADLEGSIKLLLEVMKYNIPVVAALNLRDVASRQGREISVDSLQRELGIPVIPTVAVKGEGIADVNRAVLQKMKSGERNGFVTDSTSSNKDLWTKAKSIADKSTTYCSSKLSRIDQIGKAMLRPWPGIPLALFIMILSLGIVVGAGKALRTTLLLPLVNHGIVPIFEGIILPLNIPDVLKSILIGDYGIFRISFEWIIALVLPYVLLFQLVFAFLEDSGILPRLAVLFDSLMSKIGVQGGSLINIMLGFGCTVPAIIGTRNATTKKERLVVTSIVCFSIPCISQIGALVSLLGDYSFWLLVALFATGGVAFIVSAKVTSRLIPGNVTPMILEIPNLLLPERKAFLKKFKVRIRHFLVEAEGPMLLAVVIAAILAESGLLVSISNLLKPVVSGWLGLPEEASISLILGIIRREMSVAPLLNMNLAPLQMFVGAVVSLLYIPCMSVFAILAKEFNAKTAILITLGTVVNAIFVGGLINQVVSFVF